MTARLKYWLSHFFQTPFPCAPVMSTHTVLEHSRTHKCSGTLQRSPSKGLEAGGGSVRPGWCLLPISPHPQQASCGNWHWLGYSWQPQRPVSSAVSRTETCQADWLGSSARWSPSGRSGPPQTSQLLPWVRPELRASHHHSTSQGGEGGRWLPGCVAHPMSLGSLVYPQLLPLGEWGRGSLWAGGESLASLGLCLCR